MIDVLYNVMTCGDMRNKLYVNQVPKHTTEL